MTDAALHGLSGIVIFCIGLRALFVYPEMVRKVLAINVTGTGILMFIMAMADRTPGAPPDPVPHAIVLTSIVVAVCATALLLVLSGSLYVLTGSTRLEDIDDVEGSG